MIVYVDFQYVPWTPLTKVSVAHEPQSGGVYLTIQLWMWDETDCGFWVGAAQQVHAKPQLDYSFWTSQALQGWVEPVEPSWDGSDRVWDVADVGYLTHQSLSSVHDSMITAPVVHATCSLSHIVTCYWIISYEYEYESYVIWIKSYILHTDRPIDCYCYWLLVTVKRLKDLWLMTYETYEIQIDL